MEEKIEIWKDIPGYENIYKISNLGRVKVCKQPSRRYKKPYREQIVKTHVNANDYLKVGLSKNGKTKSHPIHRLLAENFIPNPTLLDSIDHINCDKKDNRIENLRWCTHQQNTSFAWKNGMFPIRKGSECPTSLLNESSVLEIKIFLKLKRTAIKEIAKLYSVSPSTIYNIKLKRSWTHVLL